MKDSAENAGQTRCPQCDTLNDASRSRCIGCGFLLTKSAESQQPAKPVSLDFSNAQPKQSRRPTLADQVFPLVAIMLAIAAIWLGVSIRQQQQAIAAITLPATPIPTPNPTALVTRSATAIPLPTSTDTATPTPEPTATRTPLPTPTLESPVAHTIADGEALFNIALRYGVSIESIIAINEGLSPDRIVSGQTIDVPRPTATPPLTAVELTFNGETLIADPTDCVQHEIESADTYSGIARRYDVPLSALLLMNRLSAESILQPGDRVCVPTITIALTSVDDAGAVFSAEPRPPIQPQLIYPRSGSQLDSDVVLLQWVATRDLAPDEWYMIEITNLTDSLARPFRGFVQQTSFRLPDGMISVETTYRWRVSYVIVSGERGDGEFIYAYGGPTSEATFTTTR